MAQSIEEKKRKKKAYDKKRRSTPEYKKSFNEYRREPRKSPEQKIRERGYTQRTNQKPKGKKRRQEFDRKLRQTPARQQKEKERKSTPRYKEMMRKLRKLRGTGYRKSEIFEVLIERDGAVCGICGGDLPKNEEGSYFHPLVHVDHIVPVSKGGEKKALENLRLAHAPCNIKRGNRV